MLQFVQSAFVNFFRFCTASTVIMISRSLVESRSRWPLMVCLARRHDAVRAARSGSSSSGKAKKSPQDEGDPGKVAGSLSRMGGTEALVRYGYDGSACPQK